MTTKSCILCMHYWQDGDGYSDWTWMETYHRCAAHANPDWEGKEVEVPSDMTPENTGQFAKNCPKYCLAPAKPPCVSPDGEATGSPERLGFLIRKYCK